MSDSSISPFIHALVLLRAPLILNDLVTTILAFIHGQAVFIAQGVFQILSIVFGLFVVFRYFHIKKRQAVQLNEDGAVQKHSSLFLAFVDFGFALAFFILHIIGTVEVAGNWWGPHLLGAYVSFGALIAWVFHVFIAIASFHLWFQYRKKDKKRCPHCNHEIGAVSVSENRLEARSRDSKIDFEALANEAGESEGDRLILTTAED